MNARAAWRLERLGFEQVYRYAPGKADWLAAGLPTEGPGAQTLRAGTVARRDVPTCKPGDRVTDAAATARAAGAGVCMVVNDEGVVLGRLRGDALLEDPAATVEEVMEEGPTTTRADDDLEALTARMRDRSVASIVVTDPDGRLIGVLYREDAEAALASAR
ncbi:MAG TPA: CBS domain-containing protein [Acidimicrobiia bacterium]|jgi:CBS domain-containing protein